MYSRIIGTGRYLPDKILTNFDLEKMVDTSDEWIRSRTGIEERHIAADDEATSDLAYRAALAAIESAGVGAGRHRLRARRHDDARPHFPERRLLAPREARYSRIAGVQHRSRVLADSCTA